MITDKRKQNLKAGYLPKTNDEKSYLRRVEAGRRTAEKRLRIDGRFLSAKAEKEISIRAEMAGVKNVKNFLSENETEIISFFQDTPNYYHVNDTTFQSLLKMRKAKFRLNIEGEIRDVTKEEAVKYIAEMNLQIKSSGSNVAFVLKTKEYLNSGVIEIPVWDIDTFDDRHDNGESDPLEIDGIDIYSSPKKGK